MDGEYESILNLFWIVTYKAYPEVPLATVSFVGTGLSLTQTSLESLVTQVAKIAPRLGNLGFGGQFEVVNGALLIQGIMVNASVDQIKEGKLCVLKHKHPDSMNISTCDSFFSSSELPVASRHKDDFAFCKSVPVRYIIIMVRICKRELWRISRRWY